MSWPPTTDTLDLSGPWLIRTREAGPWARIDLPCAWQTVLGEDFHGVAWLRRVVRLPEAWRGRHGDARLWLRFESVATDCTAWVNGAEAGRHVGDYVPFQFDVTALAGGARARELDVVLRVDEMAAAPPARPGALQNGHLTKGFHDVISIQHGGVWQPVSLACTGPVCAIPDGVAVAADPRDGSVDVHARLEPSSPAGAGLAARLLDPEGRVVATGRAAAEAGAACLRLHVRDPRPWSPAQPTRYAAEVVLTDAHDRTSERHRVSFGFRRIEADGHALRLNGAPLFLRGVLHWGHEPRTVAPAPPEEEVRARFTRLRAMGFNCVCLCMWYAPRSFYDVADETGMLLWQQHPVWQSRMDEEDLSEYRRLYEAFLRRDASHPSVVVVSATCEHPSFHPDLAAWWWEAARRSGPGRLHGVQTAFFRWADHERADLHDEHTYDNPDRWVAYLEDVQTHLDTLPAKPFVMGETVLFTSWPDLSALERRVGTAGRWWLPRSLASQRAAERVWTDRYGAAFVERVRRQGDRFHLLGRKFEVERFRAYPRHAGLVMNHLRDVPPCQCGFMDDLDRWRFEPAECAGWLGDVAVLLETPDHRRAFAPASGGVELPCRVLVANHGPVALRSPARLRSEEAAIDVTTQTLEVAPGAIAAAEVRLPLFAVRRPERLALSGEIAGAAPNRWDLWLFPPGAPAWPRGAGRLAGHDFTAEEVRPDEAERAYSRGYGLETRRWSSVSPDPAALAPDLPAWEDAGSARPPRVLLAHRLTRAVVERLAAGARVVLLASKAPGGLDARYEWLFGGVPLVVENGPLEAGDSAWIVDLLGYDLVRRHARVVPVEDLGIADDVAPIVRLAYTHDQEHVRFFDLVFATRVGAGLLVVSSLDHSEAAGAYFLRRLVAFAARDDVGVPEHVHPHRVRAWAID